MPIEFVAQVAGVDDAACLVAGVAERADGTGRSLLFMAAHEPPDGEDHEDDELSEDNTYCLVTETQGTAYGCVRELTIDGDRLHVVLDQAALADLGLGDASVQVQLAVEPESVVILRDYLGRILTYGRPDARPAVLRL